jgi:hypothetical protein
MRLTFRLYLNRTESEKRFSRKGEGVMTHSAIFFGVAPPLLWPCGDTVEAPFSVGMATSFSRSSAVSEGVSTVLGTWGASSQARRFAVFWNKRVVDARAKLLVATEGTASSAARRRSETGPEVAPSASAHAISR